MATCRSIPSAVWSHAHAALVFYFSRRHGYSNAEDLAQETLTAILARDDFEFEKEEDFLKVCYGFASRISQTGYRRAKKHAAAPLTPDSGPGGYSAQLSAPEAGVLLDEVIRTAKGSLSADDWHLIREAADTDRATMAERLKLGDANNVRVRLHRARRKLARLTGWKGSA
jgi:DNA-directed RNA polymerase specialized sigma24 family protein